MGILDELIAAVQAEKYGPSPAPVPGPDLLAGIDKTDLISAKREAWKRLGGRWERKLPRIIGPMPIWRTRHVNPPDKRTPIPADADFYLATCELLHLLGDRCELVTRNGRDRWEWMPALLDEWPWYPLLPAASQIPTPLYGQLVKLMRTFEQDAWQNGVESLLRWAMRGGAWELAYRRIDAETEEETIGRAQAYIKTVIRNARTDAWREDEYWNRDAEAAEMPDSESESVYIQADRDEYRTAFDSSSDSAPAADRFTPEQTLSGPSFEKVDLRIKTPEDVHDLRQLIYGATILMWEVVELTDLERDVVVQHIMGNDTMDDVAKSAGTPKRTAERAQADAIANLKKVTAEEFPDGWQVSSYYQPHHYR